MTFFAIFMLMKSVVGKAEKLPALKVFLSIIIGILISDFLDLSVTSLLRLITITGLFTGIYWLSRLLESRYLKPSYQILQGLLFNTSITLFACVIYILSVPVYSQMDTDSQTFLIKPSEIKIRSNGKQVVRATILQDRISTVSNSNIEINYAYKFKGDSLHVGNLYLVRTDIANHKKEIFPGEFDYGVYLKEQGITKSGYVESSIFISKAQTEVNLLTLLENYRNHIIQLILLNEQNAATALILAFITGDKAQLDKQTKTAFSATGTMHLLAVSGLHVGILFLILDTILPFRKSIRKIRFNRSLIIVLIIWFYALITGGSPSVLRSALMISVIVPGRSSGYHPPALNSLSVAGCILLLYEPLMLFKIGFQLSFLAVAGILIIQPILNNVIQFENSIMKKIWAMVSVTLAAQLATTPIILYYFNSFPVYFLPANLLAVPLAPFVLSGGLIEIVFNSLDIQIPILHYLALLPAHTLLAIVTCFSELPFNTINNIYPDFIDTLLLYVLILLGISVSRNQSVSHFLLFLTILSIFIFKSTLENIYMKKSEELFIYKLNNKLWIAHRIGDKAQIIPTFSDTSFTNYNRSKIERHMMRLGVNRITRKSYSEVFKLNKVLLSKPVTICLMDSIEDGIDAEAFKNVCDLCIHTSRQTVGYKAITPKLVSIRIPHKNKKDFGYKRILLSEHNQLINIDLKNYSFLKN